MSSSIQQKQLPSFFDSLREHFAGKLEELTKEEEEEVEKMDRMCSYNTRLLQPIVLNNFNFNLNFNLNFLFQSVGVLRTCDQDTLFHLILQKVKTARDIPIRILSASLSPIKNNLEEFAGEVEKAIQRGCSFQLLLADPSHFMFTALSPNAKEAQARIQAICRRFQRSLQNGGVEIFLVADALFNSTYHFSSELLVINYVRGEFSASSTSAILVEHQTALFDVYEKQFQKIRNDEKITKKVTGEECATQ